jgi:hypothetical protein
MKDRATLTPIEAPRPLNQSGRPCEACGNMFLHRVDCTLEAKRHPLPPGRTMRKDTDKEASK